MSGAHLYVYIDSNNSFSNSEAKRGKWVKVDNIHLQPDEVIRKVSARAKDWGSNHVVINYGDLAKIVGKTMTICDALLVDKEQKEAFKTLLKDTLYGWHDDVFNRYQLDVSKLDD